MRTRLLLSFSAITLALLVAIVVPFGLTLANFQETKLKQDLLNDAHVLSSLVEDRLEKTDSSELVTIASNYGTRTGARLVIVNKTGIELADSRPDDPLGASYADRPEFKDALAGKSVSGIRASTTLNGKFVFVAIPVGSGGKVFGALRITYDTKQLDTQIRHGWYSLALVSTISLGVVALVSVLLSRWIIQPLRKLAETAHALGTGDLAQRVQITNGPPETRELAEIFNRTSDRLERVINAQSSFISDVSHQLRTPITALRLRLENLQDRFEADSGDQQELDKISNEVSRLTRIVDSLLALARLDLRESVNVEPIDFAELLNERADAWRALAEENGISVAVEGEGEFVANRDHVEQILDNLMANAIDASPTGSTISFKAEINDDTATLHVVDEGPGMGKSGSSKQLGGLGIGLTIAKRLAEINHASVSHVSVEPTGTDASVTFRQ